MFQEFPSWVILT